MRTNCDPNSTSLNQTVRADDYLPDIAVDHETGDIYVVWADGLGTPANNVVISKSTDGGRNWTPLKVIDQTPGPHAFNQTVQVAGDGTVAVLYYDFRNNTPAPGLPTDVWLTQSTDGGATWAEQHMTGPFDMKLAPTHAASSSATTWGWRRSGATCWRSLPPRRATRRTSIRSERGAESRPAARGVCLAPPVAHDV